MGLPSWARNGGSGGGGGGGGSSNLPSWARGSGGTAPPPAKPKKHHKGFLQSILDKETAAVTSLYTWPAQLLEHYGPEQTKGAARVYGLLGNAPVVAARHPKETLSDAYHSVTGLPEAAYTLYDTATPKGHWLPTTEGMGKAEKLLLKSVAADYRQRYGKGGKKLAEEHPLANLLDLLTIFGGGAKAASLAGASARLGEAGVGRSLSKIMQESERPGLISEGVARTRKYTYHVPGAEEPSTAELPIARGPLRRAMQDIQDPFAHQFPHIPAFGAQARVMRSWSRELPRFMDRMLGSIPGAEALDKLPEAGRTRLNWATQLKDHSDEGLRRFRETLANEYTTEVPETANPEFADWLAQAKKQGYGKELLKRFDKALKYKPDATYWRANEALIQATRMSEELMSHANGFTNIENDIKRATDRLKGLTDPEEIAAQQDEIAGLHDELAQKGLDLEEMFSSRRNRVKEWGDANAFTDTPERRAFLEKMVQHPNIGPQKAQRLIRLYDAKANASGDAAEFWRTRVGISDEDALSFVSRDSNSLFQQQPGVRGDLVEKTLAGGTEAAGGDSVFYSPFQRWLAKQSWRSMPKEELEAILQKPGTLPPREFYHAGLDLFFDQIPKGSRVSRQELLNHFNSVMNSYDLQEYHFVNGGGGGAGLHTQWDEGGELISRTPEAGEYQEIVMTYGPRTEGVRNLYDNPFSKGQQHWMLPNVVVHIRFHVFEENGVRKLLIDEIQSDWESEFRARRVKLQDVKEEKRTPEQQREIDELTALHESAKQQIGEVQRRQDAVGAREGWDVGWSMFSEQLNDMYAGLQNIQDELMRLHGPPPPSMLGPSYYRAAIRRAFRIGAEEDVDEIIISDPSVQHARNHMNHPVLGDSALDDLHMPGDYESPDPLADRPLQHVKDYYDHHPEDLENPRERMYSEDIPEFARKQYGVEPERVDNAYGGYYATQTGGRSEVGPMPGTRFRLTDEAKAKALQPSPLFQRPPQWGALPKGATELLANGDRVIHLFRGADVSTVLHELAHTAVFDLEGADRKILEDHYGGGVSIRDWKESAHENYARDFELWLREGNAPTPALHRIFSEISKWMHEIYKKVSPDHEIPQDVKDVFASMFVNRDDIPDVFIPHRSSPPDLTGARTSRGIPRASREIGDQTKSRIPLFKRNTLALMRSGLLQDDPRVLFEHLNRVAMLARANQLREAVLEIAQPLLPGDSPDFNTEYVVKRAGRGVDKPTFDAMEHADNPEEIVAAIGKYMDDHITDDGEKWKAWQGEHQLYTVDKKTVDMLFKQVTGKKPGATTGPKSGVGKVGDALLDSTRGLLLYANPGFYVANMAGNAWMTAIADPRAFRYLPWSMKNALAKATQSSLSKMPQKEVDPFWEQVSTQMGRGPTAGQLSSDQGFVGRTLKAKGSRGVAAAETLGTNLPRWWGARTGRVIDDSFRVGAWRQAARKYGYETKAEQQKLLSDAAAERGGKWHKNESKARKDLAAIRDEAENLMLDFDSMTPFERTYIARAIFLYPFLRASVKYPLMAAGERPLVTAAMGQAGLIGSEMADQAYGPRNPDLPNWAQGYARFGPGRYLNIGSVSPQAPLLGMLESGMALPGMVTGQPPPVGVNRPFSYINPLLQLAWEMSRGQNKYGRDTSWAGIAGKEAPMPGYLSQLLGLRTPSDQYSDPSEMASILRSLRLVPFGMGPQSRPTPTPVATGGGNPNLPSWAR